jgi:hypothetical protein
MSNEPPFKVPPLKALKNTKRAIFAIWVSKFRIFFYFYNFKEVFNLKAFSENVEAF